MRKILTYIWPLLVLVPVLIFAQPIGRGPIGGGGGGGGVALVK